MKSAIIGCGAISSVHADALIKQGGQIAALCDIREENARALADKFSPGCPIYSDYREMITKEKPDVVHICTPHYLHAQMAEFALDSGVNVLLEKPACISEEELESLKAAERRSKARLAICLQNRYLEVTRAAKQFLEGKKVLGVLGTVFWIRDKEYYASSDWRGRKDKEGGGLMINQAIHTFDLMMYLGGEPKNLKASIANRYHGDVSEVEDTAEIYWETEHGRAQLFATTAASCYYPINIRVHTSEGILEINGDCCKINGVDIREAGFSSYGKSYWGIGHYYIIKDFYDCISQGKEFPLGIHEAEKTHKAIFKIYRDNPL